MDTKKNNNEENNSHITWTVLTFGVFLAAIFMDEQTLQETGHAPVDISLWCIFAFSLLVTIAKWVTWCDKQNES